MKQRKGGSEGNVFKGKLKLAGHKYSNNFVLFLFETEWLLLECTADVFTKIMTHKSVL